jgi:hypothetical protein
MENMNKRMKLILITTSSIATVGLLGVGTGAITNVILNSRTMPQNVGEPVQLSSVITETNLGNVYWGKTVNPTNRQLNSILKITNNPDGSKDAN